MHPDISLKKEQWNDELYPRRGRTSPHIKMKVLDVASRENSKTCEFTTPDGKLICSFSKPPISRLVDVDVAIGPNATLDELANVFSVLWAMLAAQMQNGV